KQTTVDLGHARGHPPAFSDAASDHRSSRHALPDHRTDRRKAGRRLVSRRCKGNHRSAHRALGAAIRDSGRAEMNRNVRFLLVALATTAAFLLPFIIYASTAVSQSRMFDQKTEQMIRLRGRVSLLHASATRVGKIQ